MQGVSTYKQNGLTEAVGSRFLTFRPTREKFRSVFLPQFDIMTKEFKIFPTFFSGFNKPVNAIANLAHLLFAKGKQKANKLNSHRTKLSGA